MLVHWIWFSLIPGISLHGKRQILEQFSDAEELYYAGDDVFEAMGYPAPDSDLSHAESILRDCQDREIRAIGFRDAQYPARLRNIDDAPAVLYCRGILPEWDAQPVIGIVGTRKATPYGMETAQSFGASIAACGGLVISGGASGIDSMAMLGALETGCMTVGVLGCGVDIVYPRTNRDLFTRVIKSGCLISEYPPGTAAMPWNFPQRNRIISGVSNGLLVVEAPEKSGALNTARHAWEQGRDVFAVPGNVGLAFCAGSNALLQEHAMAALSGWDVVREYEHLYPDKVVNRKPYKIGENHTQMVAQSPQIPKNGEDIATQNDKILIDNGVKSPYSVVENRQPALTQEEQAIFSCIPRQGCHVDEVIHSAPYPAGTVRAVLTKLALKGYILIRPGGQIELK